MKPMIPNTMNPMGTKSEPANDCLADGTFDLTPRAVIRGGACLIDGSNMFRDVYDITTIAGNFKNLINGSRMFLRCRNVSSISATFPKLVNGYGMFNDINVTSFDIDISLVTDLGWAFSYNKKLTRFSSPLPNLVNASNCFNQTGLLSWDIPLPNLVFGDGMFDNCDFTTIDLQLPKCTTTSKCHINSTSLKTAIYDLPVATMIDRMFYNCAVLTDITMSCPLATYAWLMFYNCPKLVTVPDFPNLANGTAMFDGCSSLGDNTITDIIASLPTYTTGVHDIGFENVPALTQEHIDAAAAKGWTIQGTPINDCLSDGTFDTTPRAIIRGGPCLIDGREMFEGGITEEVLGNFANMTSASAMFRSCTTLTSFKAALPSLKNGAFMFQNCNLTSFFVALPNLENGNYMFSGNKNLSAESITFIIDSLPTYPGRLHYIEFNLPAVTDQHRADGAAKGWGVL